MIQRGISIFNSLLFDEDAAPPLPKPEHKGRHPELIRSRDNFLLHRFYFKSKIQRKIYLDVLAELETELFLSKMMIQKILQSKSDEMLEIKKQKPSLRDLSKMFPHINW
jgi:hypothetical protein